MDFSEIKPFCRFVRTLKLNQNSNFQTCLPLDCRLFYVKKGVGTITVGQTELTLNTGSILFINSFYPYKLNNCDVEYLAVNFDFSFSYSFLKNPISPVPIEKRDEVKPVERVILSSADCFKEYCLIKNAFNISSLLFELEKEFTEKPPYLSKYRQGGLGIGQFKMRVAQTYRDA